MPRDHPPQGALEELRGLFGDRLKRGPLPEDALALVLPRSAEEVGKLAEAAGRHRLALLAQGGGTAAGNTARRGVVLVRFDLMAATRLPDADEPWVEAEPGVTLLSLENNLEARGLGLAVYPTSAPRATVGGWLAGEGIGVGSFEYGRLPENVPSADVVLTGGGRKAVPGEELPGVLRGDPGGLVVNARLQTRPARDTPFAARFAGTGVPADAAIRLSEDGVPLWHLAFLNAAMARTRNLGERALLFGAYPQERSAAVERALAATIKEHAGRMLPPAEAHRAWGQRFFPVAPSRPTPGVDREVVPLTEVPTTLGSEKRPVQGTVDRTGEVLLLILTNKQSGWR